MGEPLSIPHSLGVSFKKPTSGPLAAFPARALTQGADAWMAWAASNSVAFLAPGDSSTL